MSIINRYKLLFFVAVLSIFLFPSFSNAARIFIEPIYNDKKVGDVLDIDVLIDTEKESLNAIEGRLSIQSSVLSCNSINTGTSFVSLWIKKPIIDEKGIIDFSGVIPGGYSSSNGNIFKLKCKAVDNGVWNALFQDVVVLKNDGLGSLLSVSKPVIQISIKKTDAPVSNDGIKTKNLEKDEMPPEIFSPIIGQDKNLFDGKNSLIFHTQDKESGIKEYFIAEIQNFNGDYNSVVWKKAESPFILSDQRLRSTILIKAVDNYGNARIITIPPRNIFESISIIYYVWYLVGGILLLGLLIKLILKYKLKKTS